MLRGWRYLMVKPYIILFAIMGGVYYGLEVMFRGYSHWSMWALGGICGILIGLINEHKFTWDTPIWKQVLIGELIVIPLEFITGCIVNLWLGWNVWNYSNLPFNLLGQVSLLFVFVFAPVILLAIVVDDCFRWLVMGGRKPSYKWF